MNASGLSVRTWNDAPIGRRDSDGFADATAMCQANGKEWYGYIRNERTTDYVAALADRLGIPADRLVITTTAGPNHLRGTWVHPRLAVDLARWLSPQFAVWMDGWFLEQLEQAALQAAPHFNPSQAAQDQLLEQRICALIRECLPPSIDRHEPAPTNMAELPPLSKWIIETIHERRHTGQTAKTHDIWQSPGCEWAGSSVYSRMGQLRRQGLVVKRGRGWHLTAAGQRLFGTTEAA